MNKEREYFNEKPVYSLTEISASLHSVIAKNYPRPYYIKAEIVKLNYYPHSGHCYPELAEKENNRIKTQIRAIIWASQFQEINARFTSITSEPLKEGINILCLATVQYDVKYGLSLYILDIEPSYTLGNMVKNKQMTIERLKKEGLFTANKQRLLPLVPKRIAVISVETSKGYNDFICTLTHNSWNYCFECQLFPSILQGEKAVISIPAQLDAISQRLNEFDCVVIIRGGGGDVGLSCYDEYPLAAAVAAFPLPVISGIGHSTNVSVTDMVSYIHKITPTDVANFLLEKYRQWDIQIEKYAQNISMQTSSILKYHYNRLAQNTDFLHFGWQRNFLQQQDKLSRINELLRIYSRRMIGHNMDMLHNFEEKIELLRPEHILKRGFSITFLNGKILTTASHVKKGDILHTQLMDGEVLSNVTHSEDFR
jgi:exodeoxyribonuclease VII large subunit